jgi:hypothetical protein
MDKSFRYTISFWISLVADPVVELVLLYYKVVFLVSFLFTFKISATIIRAAPIISNNITKMIALVLKLIFPFFVFSYIIII